MLSVSRQMGCFTLCQTNRSEISENTRENDFPIKPGEPGVMSLTIFYPLLITPFLRQRTGWSKLQSDIPTGISGPPLNVILDIHFRKKKWPFSIPTIIFRIVGIMASTPGFHRWAKLFKLNSFLL